MAMASNLVAMSLFAFLTDNRLNILLGAIYCSKCAVPSVSFCVHKSLSVGFPFVLSHTLRTSLEPSRVDQNNKTCF